jgi:hypothetical protein
MLQEEHSIVRVACDIARRAFSHKIAVKNNTI